MLTWPPPAIILKFKSLLFPSVFQLIFSDYYPFTSIMDICLVACHLNVYYLFQCILNSLHTLHVQISHLSFFSLLYSGPLSHIISPNTQFHCLLRIFLSPTHTVASWSLYPNHHLPFHGERCQQDLAWRSKSLPSSKVYYHSNSNEVDLPRLSSFSGTSCILKVICIFPVHLSS